MSYKKLDLLINLVHKLINRESEKRVL
jgi:hypothetical protein